MRQAKPVRPKNLTFATGLNFLLRPQIAVFAGKRLGKSKISPVLETEPLKRAINSGNESPAPLDSRLAESDRTEHLPDVSSSATNKNRGVAQLG